MRCPRQELVPVCALGRRYIDPMQLSRSDVPEPWGAHSLRFGGLSGTTDPGCFGLAGGPQPENVIPPAVSWSGPNSGTCTAPTMRRRGRGLRAMDVSRNRAGSHAGHSTGLAFKSGDRAVRMGRESTGRDCGVPPRACSRRRTRACSPPPTFDCRRDALFARSGALFRGCRGEDRSRCRPCREPCGRWSC